MKPGHNRNNSSDWVDSLLESTLLAGLAIFFRILMLPLQVLATFMKRVADVVR